MGMTAKEAKVLSLKIWRYLASHPGIKSKDGLPGDLFAQVKDMAMNCPLCEFFLQNGDPLLYLCGRCPLDSCMDDGPYRKWARALGCEERSFYAQQVVEKLNNWDTNALFRIE